jgi:NAD+ synthetase
VKIAILQINPRLANPEFNGSEIQLRYQEAVAKGAHLVVTPEIHVAGYIPNDMLWDPSVRYRIQAESERLARLSGPTPLILGTVTPAPSGRLWNELWWCSEGEVRYRIRKRVLPSYDVFDEHRWFEADPAPQPLVPFNGKQIGLSICEDLWANPWGQGAVRYALNPIQDLVNHGASILINASVSPANLGAWTPSKSYEGLAASKADQRKKILLDQAQHYKIPIIFASRVGADSSLVYDGSSGMASAKGLWQGAPAFEEGLVWVDTDQAGQDWTVPRDMDWLRKALVTGIRDNFHKQRMEGAIIGMSGGLDSAVVATLAQEALGPDKILGVSLPSTITSIESIRLAEEQCKNLGIELRTIPIKEPHAALEKVIQSQTGTPLAPRTQENLQSRIRGQILMALTTEPSVHKLLKTEKIAVINTANKSEAAVGYCTLYGDTVGMLSPLGDCLKSRVFDLAHAMPKELLAEIVNRPPSAELSPNQTDEQALMPYRELDLILSMHLESNIAFHLIEEHLKNSQLDFPQMSEKIKRVQMLLKNSEFKRKQMPFSLKVSPKAFGSGRQIPLTS